MKRRGILVALAATVSVACVAPRGVHHLAAAAIWTAAIAGNVVILVAHDAHLHSETCGHYRRWQDGRWIYYYEQRWEYFDDTSGQWYYYADAGY